MSRSTMTILIVFLVAALASGGASAVTWVWDDGDFAEEDWTTVSWYPPLDSGDSDATLAFTIAHGGNPGALRAMGAGDLEFLVPNRFEFGYGLTPEIVRIAAAEEKAGPLLDGRQGEACLETEPLPEAIARIPLTADGETPPRHGRRLIDLCRAKNVIDKLRGTGHHVFDPGLRAIEKRYLFLVDDVIRVNRVGHLVNDIRRRSACCQG